MTSAHANKQSITRLALNSFMLGTNELRDLPDSEPRDNDRLLVHLRFCSTAASENHGAPDIIRRLFTVRNGTLPFAVFRDGTASISVSITAVLALVLGKDRLVQTSTLGQIFESVEAAFSGLRFVGVVATFHMQYDELRL